MPSSFRILLLSGVVALISCSHAAVLLNGSTSLMNGVQRSGPSPSRERASSAGYKLLYRFKGSPDGTAPAGTSLTAIGDKLYGTTSAGGASKNGTVFELSTSGTERIVYSFTGKPDGSNATGSRLNDIGGMLYGTTTLRGAYKCDCGTLFQVSTSGAERVVHSFKGYPDGNLPAGGVIDAGGILYGMTASAVQAPSAGC